MTKSKGTVKANNIHAVWHEFSKLYLNVDGSFKDRGYRLMVKVERWAKRHPDHVEVTSADDNLHAGSRVVYIDHRSKDDYMGTSVVTIPQLQGEPVVTFLYPSHWIELLEAQKRIFGRIAAVKGRRWRSNPWR